MTRPGDAKQALTDAIGRTADFKDVKYTVTFVYTAGNAPATTTTAQSAATKSPPSMDNNGSSSDGKKFETILDGANQVFCTMPEGQPVQKFKQAITADSVDPFNGLLKDGMNWRFLDDVDLNGHKAWHLIGDLPRIIPSPNPNNIKIDVNTSEIWIDSRSGKIEKRFNHNAGSQAGSPYDSSATDTSFEYNTGLTVARCP
jgi:hypothetical protein